MLIFSSNKNQKPLVYSLFSFGLVITLAVIGCTKAQERPAKDAPAAAAEEAKKVKTAGSDDIDTEDIIEKSFFQNADGKPKTFLCGWAPEVAKGWGEFAFLTQVEEEAHCNIEFEISESYLLGKKVNPSFPDDRSRWVDMIRIPIAKHLYIDKKKDDKGKETLAENTTRGTWATRPLIKLDLSGIQLLNIGHGASTKNSVSSIEDVEWDKERHFLGFSANIIAVTDDLNASFQEKLRVNFLEFQHDETFKKTPYNQEDSQFMNILHVMGRKIEGVEPELYAAHWDVRQPTDIYITGAPPERQRVITASIEKWNDALRSIGAIKPNEKAFNPIVKELAHAFDLRYPSIIWIEDKRISINAPLGVGMAQADVRNGKILWGSVVMYGGLLEKYINSSAPVDGGEAADTNVVTAIQNSIGSILPQSLPSMAAINQVTPAMQSQLMQNLVMSHSDYLESEIAHLVKSGSVSTQAQLDAMKNQLENFKNQDPGLSKVVKSYIEAAQKESRGVSDYFRTMTIQDHLGTAGAAKDLSPGSNLAAKTMHRNLEIAMREKNPQRRMQMIRSLERKNLSTFVEKDFTAENMKGGWMAGRNAAKYSFPEMLDGVVMNLTLHEFGHIIGLGHQFKENIIPQVGTVPSRYIKDLNLKATEASEFTNYTSVMGYQSGRTEMMLTTKDLQPGPHDLLVLRYLYNRQYSAYDKSRDDWTYLPLPLSGKIPQYTQTSGGALPTAYFPQCNDIEASYGADPFCNRWDRGSRAEDIVKNYFDGISSNLLANMYSLIGGAGNPQAAEGRLWGMSLDTFSRVRLFYDEMRRRLRSEENLKSAWNRLRNDKDALFGFSMACQAKDPSDEKQVPSSVLREIMAHKDIRDLCRANALALHEMQFFMNLPEGDYTKIDHKKKYVSGGYLAGDVSTDYGHIFGSWYQLSNLPLKFTSLYTLTASNPYMVDEGYLMGNPYYDNEENRVLYRTLYPHEYTKLIADSVQHNLRFEATGLDDKTTMGRTVLAAGGLLPWSAKMSNESGRLPSEYNNLLNQQTEFQYSMVAVLIEAVKPDVKANVKADYYKKFTATIFDFASGNSTTARDVYILPNGQVIVWANGMFLYPVTKLTFYKDTSSYVVAYKVAFDRQDQRADPLSDDSVKSRLMEQHNIVAGKCIEGFAGNGLSGYFHNTNDDFDGFYIPPGIADEHGTEKITLFHRSVDTAFEKYEKTANAGIPANYSMRKMSGICDESIRGIGEISAAAGMINGFWLGNAYEYLDK